MRTLLLSGVAALALGMTGAYAQSNPTPTPAASASSNDFIQNEPQGLFRAPKLVGVAVYDSNNKDVGKVSDLLLDKDGTVKAVVVSVGGFLGIGSKDVAVPYSALHWQTERRTVATNDTNNTMASGTTNHNAMSGAAPNSQTKTATVAQTESYQGYPDRAVIDMSQAQLKDAPTFKYASSTESGGAMEPATSAKKP